MRTISELEKNTDSLKKKIKKLESLPDNLRTVPDIMNDSGISSDTSIEATKLSPIGPIVKKSKVKYICKRVFGDLANVSDKYQETLGCILGNYFVFGDDGEKDNVRDIVSEVLEVVLESNSTKKRLADILHQETYETIMQTMRVPDWVLLYFQIQARLPDRAWQNLLNFTPVGRQKCMYNNSK